MQTQALEPQQNFPAPKSASQSAAPYQLPIRYGVPFETYLRKWAEQVEIEQSKLRQLIEMSVVMRRRYRGLTLSDLFSTYGTRPETRGVFLEYDANLDGEIHPINIVQPAIRANTNACLQANAEINIESANQSAKNKNIANRWQRVADYLNRLSADEDERAFTFDALQKDGTLLVYTYAERKDAGETVPSVSMREYGLAAIECDKCGAREKKELTSEELADQPDGVFDINCPQCGEAGAAGLIKRLESYELDEQIEDFCEIKHKIYTFFNFVIDGYGAKYKGIDSAKWMQIQELVDRAEMETDYPQFDLGSPGAWSYQLQVDYALASSDFSLLNTTSQGYNASAEFDKFERRGIYLHEDAYKNYRFPEDYNFVNGAGKLTFSAKRGQTIREALEAQYGKNPEGFKFVWSDDRLLDIIAPDDEETNFRKCFAAKHWLRDSTSFHSSPNYSIVIVQDDITLLNTMNHNITAKNAFRPVYYRSDVFEESDFDQELIGTKNAALLEGGDIRKGVTTLDVPTPSPHLANQLQFLWEIKDTITLVQPALRGEMQRGETFGAQRQQLEQSHGLLTAVLKSDAQARVRTTKQKCWFAKEKWTLAQFQRVAGFFGEIWTDEDVSEMCEADFEADLIFDYKPGSEMPESNFSRELKFFQGLSQLLPLIQANPALIETDKMQRILAKIDEFADFEFDLTGLEVDEVISQKRYIELADACQEYANVPLEQIEAWRGQIAGATLDEATGATVPVTLLETIIEQIFHQTTIRFTKYENLESQGKFFTEQLRVETGKTTPNYLLIEVLQTLLGMLEQAIAQIMQEAQMQAMANDPQLQLQQQQAESDKANADEQSDKDFERKMIEKQVDRDAQTEQMQLQHAQEWQRQSAKTEEKQEKKKK